MFECCINCVAPKRHPGCHGACKDYKKDKALLDQRRENIRKEKAMEQALHERHTERLESVSRAKGWGSKNSTRPVYRREW